MTPTSDILRAQLDRLRARSLLAPLQESAGHAGLRLPYVCAIASRETNCRNELGDFRLGEYHGVGLMQIDIQHAYARQQRDSGEWQTHPEKLIGFGCLILAEGLRSIKTKLHDALPLDLLKIAAAAYNCGIGPALAGHAEGDCDRRTTGHDYGHDVMARMSVFATLLGGEE